jgi:hypothetical protein
MLERAIVKSSVKDAKAFLFIHEHFDSGTLSVQKDKNVTMDDVLIQLCADQCSKTIEAPAHLHRLAVQVEVRI